MKQIFLMMGVFLIHIPIEFFCVEVLKMGEIASAIIGGATGIIAAIITGVISVAVQTRKLKEIIRHLGFGEDEASMKRQMEAKIGSNSKSIDEQLGVGSKSLSEQLGVNTKSISEQLGVGTKSISEQLGVGVDDCSLTKQHDELKRCITEKNSDISFITTVIHNIEERRNGLNATQQGLLDTLNAFIVNWQELQSKVTRMEFELTQCKETILTLENENRQLNTIIAEYEEELNQDCFEE